MAAAVPSHPHWCIEHQVPMMSPLSATKAIDDGSESTHSGSPSEPPMSPELPRLPAAPGKLPELSPACSTLGSKSTSASPMGLVLDTESLASPVTGSLNLDSFGPAQYGVPYEPSAALEPSASTCATPTALPPPPMYYAPLVTVPGLPPAPALPPGVPEPPRAPPRLPASVPTSPPECEPTLPWPKTAPPAAAAPWQVRPQTPAPLELQPAPSGAVPAGLATTPAPTPTGGPAAGALLLHDAVPPPLQVLPDLPLDAPPPLLATDAGAAPAVGEGSLDDEVTLATFFLGMLQSGPVVPPLPPDDCYGTIFISSAISESLGEAAGAVAAAARDLGDRPVKVLLPWYPTHPGTAIFDHTKPAKVMTY